MSAAPRRVLALVPYPTGRVPGQRYRLEQWAGRLLALGLDVRFEPFLTPAGHAALQQRGRAARKAAFVLAGLLRRLLLLRRLPRYDLAYVYREAALLGSAFFERRVAARLPLVFDFDDAIYLPAVSPANRAFAFLKRPAKTAELARLARHVLAGNETLAAWARPLARAVSVVPSTVDTDLYAVLPRPRAARAVVGWTGSATTLPHLEALHGALLRLLERRDYELRVIGGQPRLPGLPLTALPWRAESEVPDLRPIDVGLMPLPDDEWARGKCGMKALQYMALGIPPVVSPVGVNASLVDDGRNGFHARSPDEWVERVGRLLADEALCARLGARARETVAAGYSAAVVAPRVAELLHGLAA